MQALPCRFNLNEVVGGDAMIRKMIIFTALAASRAEAKVCDYRPSQLIGGSAAGAVGVGSASTAATGASVTAAGFYTLTNATTGATMLASTAAGSSAAGTVGIIGGTSGLIGATVAVLTAPVTIIAGVATATAVGGYEGVCYFSDDRITDFYDVYTIMKNLADNADPAFFRMENAGGADATIFMRDENGEEVSYQVQNLYIVNGILMHRDWFRNTTVGKVSFLAEDK